MIQQKIEECPGIEKILIGRCGDNFCGMVWLIKPTKLQFVELIIMMDPYENFERKI